MKETSFMKCKASMAVFDEVVGHTQVMGVHTEFLIHMGDFYELPENLQADIEHDDLYTL